MEESRLPAARLHRRLRASRAVRHQSRALAPQRSLAPQSENNSNRRLHVGRLAAQQIRPIARRLHRRLRCLPQQRGPLITRRLSIRPAFEITASITTAPCTPTALAIARIHRPDRRQQHALSHAARHMRHRGARSRTTARPAPAGCQLALMLARFPASGPIPIGSVDAGAPGSIAAPGGKMKNCVRRHRRVLSAGTLIALAGPPAVLACCTTGTGGLPAAATRPAAPPPAAAAPPAAPAESPAAIPPPPLNSERTQRRPPLRPRNDQPARLDQSSFKHKAPPNQFGSVRICEECVHHQ